MLGARTTLSSMVEVLVLVLSSMLVEAAGALVVDTARGSSGHEDRPSSQLPDAASAGAGCLPMGWSAVNQYIGAQTNTPRRKQGAAILIGSFYLHCCLAHQQDCLCRGTCVWKNISPKRNNL